jgi:hypothetical protein
MSLPVETPEASRSQLVVLNERMLNAEQRGGEPDVAYLATVVSDHLLFRRADKTIVDKATFLETVPSSARKLTDRRGLDLEVAVLGESALVTMRVMAFAEVDGRREPRLFKNIRFFVMREGRWLLEHWYNEETTAASEDVK